VQKPHPPIWIPGGGSIETWDFCADYDYNYSSLSYFGYKRAAQVMKGYWDVIEQKGRDYNPYRAGFAQVVAVAETDALAEKEYAPHLDYFFNRCLHVSDGFADAPGYRTQKTVEAGLKAQVGSLADMMRQSLTWKQLIDLNRTTGDWHRGALAATSRVVRRLE
jgi:alkanesulfonate monooxygenase SsuD/methylene tetrahydromethanopterin reductase-like flavin-dependent oxidoreductase (luciferase family)